MNGVTENPESASNQALICGSDNRMAEFSDTAHEYGRKISDAAGRASDYIEQKASVLGDKFKDLQGKNFQEIADDAKDYARRKPGHAILIAAGAGLILGFFLRNGKRYF